MSCTGQTILVLPQLRHAPLLCALGGRCLGRLVGRPPARLQLGAPQTLHSSWGLGAGAHFRTSHCSSCRAASALPWMFVAYTTLLRLSLSFRSLALVVNTTPEVSQRADVLHQPGKPPYASAGVALQRAASAHEVARNFRIATRRGPASDAAVGA